MKKLLVISVTAIAFLMQITSFAQTSKIFQDEDADFKWAKELFQQEQFTLAYPVFKKIYNDGIKNTNIPFNLRQEAKYYYIRCGLQLNDTTAAAMAQSFIELEKDMPHVEMLQYHLGEYYYRRKELPDALALYEKTSIANLNNREIADMKFHQGYAYFTMQRFNEAKPLFDVVRQIPKDPNYIDANYYYGFIAFTEKNYTQATESFLIATASPDYQPVIPFYLTEIYYFTGQQDKALETGEAALQKGGQYYELQLKQLIGHIWFEKKQYAKALPYLEAYVSAKDKVRREDLYELSYCYYEAKNWTKSIEGFKQLGGKEDSLAQNCMYLLADAYLKIQDKPNARNAFLFCADNNSNLIQKEISIFNYAKLSYDLGYMDAALKGLKSYIDAYPNSAAVQEARELLVSTLANTSNYREGLILYDGLPAHSEATEKVLPRLLYGRATELIGEHELEHADSILTRLIAAPFNLSQLPLAYFWKGEIAYRDGNNDAAIGYLNNYLKTAIIHGEVNPTNAMYSLGYAWLKNENYQAAKGQFEKVAGNITANASNIEQDAYIRAADCYFMDKDFKQSLKMYEQAIAYQWTIADYAYYQKAIIAGALNKNTDKVEMLAVFEQKYPGSSLVSESQLELANTYLANENYEAALAPLQKLIKNTKADALKPEAYLKSGIAYFNLDKNEESLDRFKNLVTQYTNSKESDDAIEYIRNIFIEQQQPDAFVSFMRDNGKPVTYAEEDSLTFRSAMLRYEMKDWNTAGPALQRYVSKFPDGRYALEANYLAAEILTADKKFIQALPFYTTLAVKAPNQYAERSILQAARTYYFEQKDYANAEKYFVQLKSLATQQENKLEAMRGLLRCQFKAQKWAEAAPNARDLLLENGIATDDRMMASMVVARNHQINKEFDPAITAYKQVIAAGKSEYGAESQYRIAEILLEQTKLTDAEKAAFEVIKRWGSYQLWVTKSYILLGDVYFAQKDWFNAEATYKSIVDNATLAELKTEAQEKLDKVIEEKNKTNKVEQE